jgi:hypothetical protein
MPKRPGCYQTLVADYSKPGLVPADLRLQLLAANDGYSRRMETTAPVLDIGYSKSDIEAENRAWFPSHCEALRSGRFDLLGREYRDEYVYLCQDGPFYGKHNDWEKHWVAIIAQPDVTMCWPIVMFEGEVIYFEWHATDDDTGEIIAKGNVTFWRRGHRGGISLKTEQLTFSRDVSAAAELRSLLTI